MYEIDTEDILKAQNKDEKATENIINNNTRADMEHSKQIYK